MRWAISLLLAAFAAIVLVVMFRHDPTQPTTELSAYSPPITSDAITPIPQHVETDPRKRALGEKLFADGRLSKDNTIACTTCHILDRGGQNGQQVATGIGGQKGEVNTPTIFNSMFNFRQFWDGRAADLNEQIDGPISNPKEMGEEWPHIVSKLTSDRAISKEFSAIWPDGIRASHIREAIAEYERSLYTPDAPFDHYLRGDYSALEQNAIKGWQLFQTLGCISCHQGVNIGGNMFANLGIMGDFFKDRGTAETIADRGRFNVTGNPSDMHLFKVPSLRNVALTAPYFHDGSVPTLDKAVEIMGHYQLGVDLPPTQRDAIVAFLTSLTGRPPRSDP